MGFIVIIIFLFSIILLISLIATGMSKSRIRKENEQVIALDKDPFVGIAAELLEVGYNMREHLPYRWSCMFLGPLYNKQDIIEGYMVRVTTSEKPRGDDLKIMSNFLSDNQYPGNWTTHTNKFGNLYFLAEFGWPKPSAYRWRVFKQCVQNRLEKKHADWKFVNDDQLLLCVDLR